MAMPDTFSLLFQSKSEAHGHEDGRYAIETLCAQFDQKRLEPLGLFVRTARMQLYSVCTIGTMGSRLSV